MYHLQLFIFFFFFFFFFFNDTATTEIYTLSLHDALPIYGEWIILIDVHAGLRRALAVEKSAVAKIGDDNRLQEIKILRRLRSFQLFDTFLLKNEQGRLEERDNRAKLQCLPFYIEGNRQGADLRRGEENLQVLDAIANQNCNGIALAHAQGEQAVSKLVYPRIQFAVGDV